MVDHLERLSYSASHLSMGDYLNHGEFTVEKGLKNDLVPCFSTSEGPAAADALRILLELRNQRHLSRLTEPEAAVQKDL